MSIRVFWWSSMRLRRKMAHLLTDWRAFWESLRQLRGYRRRLRAHLDSLSRLIIHHKSRLRTLWRRKWRGTKTNSKFLSRTSWRLATLNKCVIRHLNAPRRVSRVMASLTFQTLKDSLTESPLPSHFKTEVCSARMTRCPNQLQLKKKESTSYWAPLSWKRSGHSQPTTCSKCVWTLNPKCSNLKQPNNQQAASPPTLL